MNEQIVVQTTGGGGGLHPVPVKRGHLVGVRSAVSPCVAAIVRIKRELGGKWAVGVVTEQCVIAWLAAGAVRLIGLLLGMA